jgi:hypothetical protein
MELKKPDKEFWNQISIMNQKVKEWVLAYCWDQNYEYCGFMSDVLYRLITDWGIEKYEQDGWATNLRIVDGFIGKVKHSWVEVYDYIYDPTVMQFSSDISGKDYIFYDSYYGNETDAIFESERITYLCKKICPELYN